MRLCAITDGVSQDFGRALAVLAETRLAKCEIQDLWGSRIDAVGDTQIAEVQRLLERHEIGVACISPKLFGGLPVSILQTTEPAFQAEINRLKHCLDIAYKLRAPAIRVMSPKREGVLYSRNGPSIWNNGSTWDRFVDAFRIPVKLAETAGITLMVETSLTGLVNSAHMGNRLVESIGSPHLKILWDPANCLYCGEEPPEGIGSFAAGALGHVHIKDVRSYPCRSTIDCCPLGAGDMNAFFHPMTDQLAAIRYGGAISFENIYCPDGETVEDGFRASVPMFRSLFGRPI
jgi:sugar phosphate isomerase/epimerase